MFFHRHLRSAVLALTLALGTLGALLSVAPGASAENGLTLSITTPTPSVAYGVPTSFSVTAIGSAGQAKPSGLVQLVVNGFEDYDPGATQNLNSNGIAVFPAILWQVGTYNVAVYYGGDTYGSQTSTAIKLVVTAGMPTAPAGVTASPSATSMTVAYGQSNYVGNATTTYVATATPVDGGAPVSSATSQYPNLPLTINGLTASTAYSVIVTASTAAGQSPSSPLVVDTLPAGTSPKGSAQLTMTSPASTNWADSPFTYTVSVQGSPTVPTGDVAFFVDGVGAGTVPVVNGLATFNDVTRNAGNYVVTAMYEGDALWAPNTTSTLRMVQGDAPTGATDMTVTMTTTSMTVSYTPGSTGGLPTTYQASAKDLDYLGAGVLLFVSPKRAGGPLTITGLTPGHLYWVSMSTTNIKGNVNYPLVKYRTPLISNTGTTGPDGTATAASTSSSGETVTAVMTGAGSVTSAWYASAPPAGPVLPVRLSYFDVFVVPAPGGGIPSQVVLTLCKIPAGTALQWLTAANVYQPVSAPTTVVSGCSVVTLNDTTSPRPADLTGTVFAVPAAGPVTSDAHMTKPATTTALTKSFPVAWTGTKVDGSAIASYDVRYTHAAWNGKFGSAVTWKSAVRILSANFTGALGGEYCFSVRARNASSVLSPWSAAKCTALPLDERALKASAGWLQVAKTGAFNGTERTTKIAKKTLTLTGVPVGRAALVVTKAVGAGSVTVLYNGTAVKTFSLTATATHYKQLVALPKVTRANTTIVIKTTLAKLVQIDGLLLARI